MELGLLDLGLEPFVIISRRTDREIWISLLFGGIDMQRFGMQPYPWNFLITINLSVFGNDVMGKYVIKVSVCKFLLFLSYFEHQIVMFAT